MFTPRKTAGKDLDAPDEAKDSEVPYVSTAREFLSSPNQFQQKLALHDLTHKLQRRIPIVLVPKDDRNNFWVGFRSCRIHVWHLVLCGYRVLDSVAVT